MIVISRFFHKITKEFYTKQISVLGPTNRFKNNIAKKFKNNYKNDIILILSGIMEIDKALIKVVTDVCLVEKKLKFM